MKTEILGVGIGDILKYEATALTRVKVAAEKGTKAGTWVNFALRGDKLAALTDEADGHVVVQPHNCIIDLSHCAKPDNTDETMKNGDRYGIRYIGIAGAVLPKKETEPATAEPSVPPVPLKRMLTFIGDSTNARIGDQARTVAKTEENLTVVNNAQGGSLAAYALMSMNASPVTVSFSVAELPAKGSNVSVDATLAYGEGVTPFSMHSTTVIIGDNIEASITGQSTAIKVIPRDNKTHTLEAGKSYPVRLKNSGSTDGICVIATGKNDINGANTGNWQTVLARVTGYVEKCVSAVEPKAHRRFIVLTNWADNKPGWVKETYPFRHQLKNQFNQWIKSKYGKNVYDIEAYMLSDQIWTDTGISPNEADRQAQKDGIMPLSLSHDSGAHFLPAVEAKIAEQIIAKAKELGYL